MKQDSSCIWDSCQQRKAHSLAFRSLQLVHLLQGSCRLFVRPGSFLVDTEVSPVVGQIDLKAETGFVQAILRFPERQRSPLMGWPQLLGICV